MVFCSECGKKETIKRSINKITKICSDCNNNAALVSSNDCYDNITKSDIANVSLEQISNTSTIIINEDYWKQFDNRLDTKIKTVETNLTNLITTQNQKIELLEKKCETYEENIDNLKAIVSKQQITISSIDQDKREKNIIISGMNEDIIEYNDTKYETDIAKIDILLEILGVTIPDGYEALRIGKQHPNYHRIIKMNVHSKHSRDTIMNVTKKLKDVGPPWDKIYLKKDLHPAMIQENNRLRFKLKKLKSLEENNGKNVKIEKGKLKIDNVIVDQNLLFL